MYYVHVHAYMYYVHVYTIFDFNEKTATCIFNKLNDLLYRALATWCNTCTSIHVHVPLELKESG